MKLVVHLIGGAMAIAVVLGVYTYIVSTCGQCPWHNGPGECCYPAQERTQ